MSLRFFAEFASRSWPWSRRGDRSQTQGPHANAAMAPSQEVSLAVAARPTIDPAATAAIQSNGRIPPAYAARRSGKALWR